MKYSDYTELALYSYTVSYVSLCQYIDSLCEQTEGLEEMGFYGYTEDSIDQLQTSLRANQDRAHKLSEQLRWFPKDTSFEEFKLRLQNVPKEQRPIFPDPKVIDSVRALLSAIWNRLNQQSNVLDNWPNMDVDAFTNELNLALRDLVNCRVIITEHDICKGEGEISSNRDETPENELVFSDEDDEADADGFRDIPAPSDLEDTDEDDLHAFLDLNPDASTAGFSAGKAYKAAIDSLRNAMARLCECLAADQADQADEYNPGRLLFDRCREALIEDLSFAMSALEDCYSHSGAFEAWLAGAAADDVPLRLEPSTANFLQDAVAELSKACDALNDIEQGESGSPEDWWDNLGGDSLDSYEVADYRYEDIFGSNDTQANSKTDSTGETLFSQRLTQARDIVGRILAALGIAD